jgi:hypothetical protein
LGSKTQFSNVKMVKKWRFMHEKSVETVNAQTLKNAIFNGENELFHVIFIDFSDENSRKRDKTDVDEPRACAQNCLKLRHTKTIFKDKKRVLGRASCPASGACLCLSGAQFLLVSISGLFKASIEMVKIDKHKHSTDILVYFFISYSMASLNMLQLLWRLQLQFHEPKHMSYSQKVHIPWLQSL